MTNIKSYNTSTAAINFLENASYGDHFLIKDVLFQVTKWNYNHIILTRNGDQKEYRYNFKAVGSCD